jgi:peptide deformylase
MRASTVEPCLRAPEMHHAVERRQAFHVEYDDFPISDIRKTVEDGHETVPEYHATIFRCG